MARPKLTIGLWAAVTLVLAVQGLSFAARLSPSAIDVPGTSSERAQQVAARYFGIEASIPVLLQGPRADLDRQGRRLVRQLRAHKDYRVLSPWDRGAKIPELRPRTDAALVLVVARTDNSFAGTTGHAVRRQVDAEVRSPVRASVTGFSTVGGDLKDASLSAAHEAELVAIPVLLIVLLLVFRSPIAALIPGLFGLAAVESGYGAVGLIATVHPITDVATALTSMMGLALGVDYSLLLVSRFREELAHGAEPAAAARTAQGSAGRTVLFAGATLVVAMGVAILLSPGDFLVSAAVSVATVAVISMGGAFLVVPAILGLLGHRVDKWRIGGIPRDDGNWASMARFVQRRPLVLGGLALLPLLALSVPALGLDTGPPDVRTLPKNAQARIDSQRTIAVLGPGWGAPFEVFVTDPDGPVTTATRLRAMERWQRRIARLPAVQTVIGPGAISQREPGLLDANRSVDRTQRALKNSRGQARKLSGGLAQARGGVASLRGGLRDARTASDQLGSGAGQGSAGAARLAAALTRARGGARQLRTGILRARDGAAKLSAALTSAQAGSRRLTSGLGKARQGARKLADGSGQLAAGLRSGQQDLTKLTAAATDAQAQTADLLKALSTMTLGRTDPRYRAALEAAGKLSAFATGKDPRNGQQIDPAYPGLSAALQTASGQLTQAADAAAKLQAGADQLQAGLQKLKHGSASLTSGLGKLDTGAGRLEHGLGRIGAQTGTLPSGLGQLADGADKLAAGLTRLEDGNRQLAAGLADGNTRSAKLQRGLAQARRQTANAASQGAGQDRQLKELQDRSPRLLDSGYFVLAALDGSSAGARTQAGYSVNLQGGGQAARITIIPKYGINTPQTTALNHTLQQELPSLERSTHANADLGGVAAQITDYQRILGARLPVLIIALSLVTLLVLVLILRTLVLPLISIVLNLLTVGASFGMIALLFQGQHPTLGGPGWADILSLLATFTIVFGLSLDYQVFILTRMREAFNHGGDLGEAITFAIDRTGRVVTGAAAIMGGVFIAFTTTDLTIIKQSGVGLASAVIIDATLVRMVLLPAAMRLAGRSTFWLPAWLDRLLPELDVDGAAEPTQTMTVQPA
ncbi:MMPL family transporter [Paraconexibacter antarcticus]|uniref:MMPL family transporter n=1 Tax=Paraconexibacter antarcticus TaxID=2949664 RepID=A0ABY5DMQ0_9ACTN|nr:MMPL family transporter [Paraconexibacter antarcticus]UTI63258.1 MMPL family transporter [Paraconexibacter antarcticus]